jgi:hypothetical protein
MLHLVFVYLSGCLSTYNNFRTAETVPIEFDTEEFHSVYIPIMAQKRQISHIYMKTYMSFGNNFSISFHIFIRMKMIPKEFVEINETPYSKQT